MIKVELTGDARQHIIENGAAVTIDMMELGGCGGNHREPALWTEKPASPENYDLIDADGIQVYLYKDAKVKPEGIKISLEIQRKTYKKLLIEGLVYHIPGL